MRGGKDEDTLTSTGNEDTENKTLYRKRDQFANEHAQNKIGILQGGSAVGVALIFTF